MSGPAALLATLGALYLIECIAAVPGGYTAFRGTARASWRAVADGLRFGTRGARLVFLPLLPWTRGLVLAADDAVSLDAAQVREWIAAWRDAAAALRVDAVGMFALVFVLGPIFVRFFGWSASWPFLAIGVVVLAALIVGDFRAAHARLFPERRGVPAAALFTIALSPASAMRAPDLLLRELVARHHPLAVAQALCEREQYEYLAGRWMREQRRLQAIACGDGRQAAEQSAMRDPRSAIEAFITATVREPHSLLGPPARRDADAVSYCPSCLDEYSLAAGACDDCGGVALARFP